MKRLTGRGCARDPAIDLDTYLAMPEDVSRTIEVKDGLVVFCESPSPNHAAVAHAVKGALRDAGSQAWSG